MLNSKGYTTGAVGKWHLGFGEVPKDPAAWRGIDWNGEIKPGPLEIGFDYAFVRAAMGGPVPQVYVEGHRVVGLNPADPIRTTFPGNYPGYLAVKRNASNIGPKIEGGASARYKFDQTAIVETGKATAFIEAHAGQPFFLYFATHNIHSPVTPGEKFSGKNAIGEIGDFIEELDWIVGQVMETLERHDLARNTLIFFTSDNGPAGKAAENGDRVVKGHDRNGPWHGVKTEAYEGGHRVPLVVRWPGRIKPGSRSDALVALTDVLATSAELVGHPLPDNAAEDSFSFLHALLQRKPAKEFPSRTSVVCDGWLGDYSIRDRQWKLILPAPDFPKVRAGSELFNMAKDPGETKNMAEQHPEIVVRLTKLFGQLRDAKRSRPLEY